MKLALELTTRDAGLGPWVDLELVAEDGRRHGLLSVALNERHFLARAGELDLLAFGVVADGLRRAFEAPA